MSARRRRCANASEAPSAWETLTVQGRPVSVAVPPTTTLPVSFSASALSVPATVTRSAAPSPPAVIGTEARLMSTSWAPVRLRSPIANVSAPPPSTGSISSTPGERQRDVAGGEPQPAAVGFQGERLGGVGAGEGQRVAAGAAVDDVAAVAGLPAEAVEVAAEERDVLALAAADVVEAVAADQVVVAGPADQDVVAVAADQRQIDGVRGRADDVVAAAAVDRQVAIQRGVRRAARTSGRAARSSPNEIWSSSSEPYAVVRSASASTWKTSVAERSAIDSSSARGADDLDAVEFDGADPDAVAGGLQIQAPVVDRERVEALAAVDAHAVDLVPREGERLGRRA